MIIQYDPRTRIGSPQPFVSINQRGILLSAAIVEQNRLGSYRHALLSFDPKDKLIIITFVKKGADRSVAVGKPKKGSNSLFINARGFFTFMDLVHADLLGRYEPIVKAAGDTVIMTLNLTTRPVTAAAKASKQPGKPSA